MERIAIQNEVYEFLISQPTLDDIVRFQISLEMQEHLRVLLEANRNGTLTGEQKAELDEHVRIGHVIRMLKIHARQRLLAV